MRNRSLVVGGRCSVHDVSVRAGASSSALMAPHNALCSPPLPPRQDALLRMDGTALSVEQLAVLSRAVPDDQERKDIELYMGGKHPKYKCGGRCTCQWLTWKQRCSCGECHCSCCETPAQCLQQVFPACHCLPTQPTNPCAGT